jgi:anionic cell wall polymer biosynthesis LytR-Cps2A-Psr (LCP) family protein
VLVNFNTYSTIIDALGGVDVENPYEFTTIGGNGGGDYTFAAGTIHLDGEAALAYVRERYNLPDGDMGRSEHQLIVLQAIINKMTSSEILSKYNQVLKAMQGEFLTNIDTDDIYALVEKQVDEGGSWNVVKYHLLESGDYQETASMPGQSLYVGWLYDNQVQFVVEQINAVLNGQTITQQELPAGE